MKEFTFHMGEAMAIFEALKTDQISREVLNAELGSMGATEVTVFNSKIGMELEMQHSNGGCTLIVRNGGKPIMSSEPPSTWRPYDRVSDAKSAFSGWEWQEDGWHGWGSHEGEFYAHNRQDSIGHEK